MKIPEFKLGIVDDDRLVVQLLSEYLGEQPGIDLCLTAHGGNELQAIIESGQALPNVLLLDLKMADGDGLAAMDFLGAHPTVKIVVLSSYFRSSFTGFMLRSGVSAFLPKDTDKSELLQIIREVHTRGFYFYPEQVEALRKTIAPKSPAPKINPVEDLSDREVELIKLICQQLTTKEIADKMFISPKTVEAHKSRIFLKTGIKNTAGLIIYSVQQGVIDPDEFMLL